MTLGEANAGTNAYRIGAPLLRARELLCGLDDLLGDEIVHPGRALEPPMFQDGVRAQDLFASLLPLSNPKKFIVQLRDSQVWRLHGSN